MASQKGQRLSAEETEEYLAYKNAGIHLPDKFNKVVFDNASRGDSFYRYPTEEEEKADAERTEVERTASARQTKLDEKVRKEAQARGVPVVPERPADTEQGRQVAGQTSPREAGGQGPVNASAR